MMKITCGSFFPLKLEFFARFGFNRPWKPEGKAVETAALEGDLRAGYCRNKK
jgi:hypothetical protein